jgi:hypothetical protein
MNCPEHNRPLEFRDGLDVPILAPREWSAWFLLPPKVLSSNTTGSKNWRAQAEARKTYREECGWAARAELLRMRLPGNMNGHAMMVKAVIRMEFHCNAAKPADQELAELGCPGRCELRVHVLHTPQTRLNRKWLRGIK